MHPVLINHNFMKTIINRYMHISGFLLAIVGVCAMLLLSSCSTGKWYVRSHDGCQSSQGMAGYGNK